MAPWPEAITLAQQAYRPGFGRPPSFRGPDGRLCTVAQDALGVCRLLRRLGLSARDLVAVKLDEVDVFKVERREATVACDITDDTTDERKDHAWAFDQKEWVQLLIWHPFNVENTDILHL